MNEQSLFMKVLRSSKPQFRNKVEIVSQQLIKKPTVLNDFLKSILIFLAIRGVKLLFKKKTHA